MFQLEVLDGCLRAAEEQPGELHLLGPAPDLGEDDVQVKVRHCGDWPVETSDCPSTVPTPRLQRRQSRLLHPAHQRDGGGGEGGQARSVNLCNTILIQSSIERRDVLPNLGDDQQVVQSSGPVVREHQQLFVLHPHPVNGTVRCFPCPTLPDP